MSFEAIIIASGLGKRLKPFTKKSPKPMLPLLGMPLMGHTVRSLMGAGVSDVNIVGHKNTGLIAHHFGSNPAYAGAKINLARMDRLRGTAYALRFLKGSDKNVIVCYGDVVLDNGFPWQQFLQSHESRGADVTILYKQVADARTGGVLDLKGDRIERIREKPFLGSPEAVPGNLNAAVYLLSPRAARRTGEIIREVEDPENTKNDFVKNVFPQLLEEGFSFYGFDLGDGYWMSVDRPEQYRQIFLDYLRGELHIEIARSYAEIGADGSWGYKPFLQDIEEQDLISAALTYFTSALAKFRTKEREEGDAKEFIDRVVLLRYFLGKRAVPFFKNMMEQLERELKLSWAEKERTWNTLLFDGFDFDEMKAREIARKGGTVFGGTGYSATKGLLRAVDLKNGETVCDIGSGMGHFCIAGAVLYPEVNFVGIEKIPELLRIARAMARRHGLKNVRFIRGDALTADYSPYGVLHMYNPLTAGDPIAFYKELADRLAKTMNSEARLISVGIDDPMDPAGPFPDTIFMPRFSYGLLGDGEGSPVIYHRR